MKQQKEPNAPHQVINTIQAPMENLSLRDAYNIKAATAFGVIHIICGFIALIAEIAGLVTNNHFPTGNGIWTSVFFFISGGLAIGGAQSGNKYLMVATLVMTIISAVSAAILLIMSTIFLHAISNYTRSSLVSYVLLVATGATMLVIAIASVSLTCYPLFCRSTKQAALDYNHNQVPATVHYDTDQMPTTMYYNQMTALNQPTVQGLKTHTSTSVQVERKWNDINRKQIVFSSSFCQTQASLQPIKMSLEWEANIKSFNSSSGVSILQNDTPSSL